MTLYVFAITNASIRSEQESKRILIITLIFVFLGGPISGIYQLAMRRYIFSSMSEQAQAQFNSITYIMFAANNGNSNYSSLYMLLAMMLCLIGYYQSNKLVYFVCAVISAICLVMTFSRGTILGAVIGFFIFILYQYRDKIETQKRKRRNKTRNIVMFLACIAFVIPVINYTSDLVESYFSSSYARVNLAYKMTGSGMDERILIWKSILDLVSKSDLLHLVIGYGSNYVSYFTNTAGLSISAHNYLFEQLAMNGVTGFLLSVGFFVYLARSSFIQVKSNQRTIRLVGILGIDMLVSFMFLSTIDVSFISSIALIEIAKRKLIRNGIENER